MDWWKRIFLRQSPLERAEKLMTRALALLDEGKSAEALDIAQKLHSMRYSGGYEIEAQALAREGSKDEAIAVLRKGIEAAPSSWLNHNLLGNYLSDQGYYDEAFATYDEALLVPSVSRAVVEANYALALRRAGREKEAQVKMAAISERDLSAAESGLRAFVEDFKSGS